MSRKKPVGKSKSPKAPASVEKKAVVPQKKPSVLLGVNLKQRLILSLLYGFAVPFTLFAGVFEIFASNRAEFDFAFGDFFPLLLLICLGLSAILTLALVFFKGKVFDVIFAFFFGILLAGVVQSMFLNIGADSLMGDGVGAGQSVGWAIGNALIWLTLVAGCILCVCLVRKGGDMVYTGAVILMVVMIGMQIPSMVITGLNGEVTAPPAEEEGHYVLTEKDIYQVSSKKNVVVFVLDRFDRTFAEHVMANDPAFFEDLDGFTYYEDNVSLYMRTFPASPSMLTGIENDFSMNAADYLAYAYTNSPFLKTLKENNYKVNIYVDDYYCYRDASVFAGVADNVYRTNSEYTITQPWTLTSRLVAMSAYRYAPIAAKSLFNLSSGSFSGFVEYLVPEKQYEPKDAALYEKIMNEGVTVQDEQDNFTYIHLAGCHPPYYIDEDGSDPGTGWREDIDWAGRAMKGCFLIIKEYIEGLKAAGAYEDATIIITGDHPNPDGDYRLPTEPRLTALFVKRAGEAGTPFAKLSTPVAQANLIPSLVLSAGLETDIDFGKPYWAEDLPTERTYRHTLNHSAKECDIVEYRITGDGRDFSNWEKISQTPIGDLYG